MLPDQDRDALAHQIRVLEARDADVRALLDDSPVGLFRTRPDGTILYANLALVRLLRYPSREALLATNAADLYAQPGDRQAMLARVEADGTLQSVQARLRRADGAEVWVEFNICRRLGPAGEGAFYEGAVADVTSRRLAEQALGESEWRYRTLAEAARDFIFVVGREGRLEYVNRWAATALGETPEALVGRALADLFPPDVAERHRSRIVTVFETREPAYWEEPDNLRGREVWLGTSLAPVEDESGHVRAVLGISRDITERKSLEEQYRQAQKLEALGQFAGGVAHDFNNLLTAILGYANLLQGELGPAHRLAPDVAEILKAGERAAALTRRLMAFARKQHVQPRVLDLGPAVGELAAMLPRLVGEDVEIRLGLDPATPRVLLDPVQLEQILLNLASNARDAMPGGGRITIETGQVTLSGTSEASRATGAVGHFAFIAVGDTGTGMDAAIRDRIFEPFFTTKPQGKGTGLGLSTVYGIVRQAGGHVWASSEVNAGTTVYVYLPLEAGDLAPGRSAGAAGPSLSGSETILLVEDEDVVRALAQQILERRGYRVLAASGGEEALRLASARNGDIDLLVTDVVMPQMNGRELAERLTAAYPAVCVLFMSGYAEGALVPSGPSQSVAPFLPKPYSPDTLVRAVREALDGCGRRTD